MVSLEIATQIADSAQSTARSMSVNAVVSIVDKGGHLVLLRRMDGAPFGAVRFSERKAMSAAALGAPTAALAEVLKSLPGLMSAAVDGIAFVGGGHPIIVDGVLSGGIGIAGGFGEQDDVIAKAGLSGFKQ
jgi:uncharacterized protein GlcG (DUF336 family)